MTCGECGKPCKQVGPMVCTACGSEWFDRESAAREDRVRAAAREGALREARDYCYRQGEERAFMRSCKALGDEILALVSRPEPCCDGSHQEECPGCYTGPAPVPDSERCACGVHELGWFIGTYSDAWGTHRRGKCVPDASPDPAPESEGPSLTPCSDHRRALAAEARVEKIERALAREIMAHSETLDRQLAAEAEAKRLRSVEAAAARVLDAIPALHARLSIEARCALDDLRAALKETR